jgi:hypothetical protein
MIKRATSRFVLEDRFTLRACPAASPDVGFLSNAAAPKTEAAHFVTLGKFGRFSDDNRARAFSYCQRLMMVEQPGRQEATSFLLNTAAIQFVKVERHPNGGGPADVPLHHQPAAAAKP